MIQGIPVTLYQRTQIGANEINEPVYMTMPETVENVLIGQPTTDDITDAMNLYGKRLEYMLFLPKGDAHEWENNTVVFFDRTFRVFGAPMELIEENIPAEIPWNKRVRVELVT